MIAQPQQMNLDGGLELLHDVEADVASLEAEVAQIPIVEAVTPGGSAVPLPGLKIGETEYTVGGGGTKYVHHLFVVKGGDSRCFRGSMVIINDVSSPYVEATNPLTVAAIKKAVSVVGTTDSMGEITYHVYGVNAATGGLIAASVDDLYYPDRDVSVDWTSEENNQYYDTVVEL